MESNRTRKQIRAVSIICYVTAICWLLVNPYFSISKGLQKPSLIRTVDKNIPPSLDSVATKEDMDFSIQLQDQLCDIDQDDVLQKLNVIQSQFESIGLSFTSHHGDLSLARYINKTAIDLMPTLVYGVWHPTQSTESPTSIILSTEMNLNVTANPKALHYNTDCSYSIPSSISTLLTLIHSMQQLNHDIVFAIHINKYEYNTNQVVQKQDVEFLLQHISLPLFSLHMEFPGSVISFSHVIDGFDLYGDGLNGKNANLDLISILLHNLPILHYDSYQSYYANYVANFVHSAMGRYFGIHQYYLQKNIPAASIVAISKPATLQQRTHQGREGVILSLYTSLKKAVCIAASAEERIQKHDNVYLPLFTSDSRETRYVSKYDMICPCLLLVGATVLLLWSYNQFKTPTKPSWLYCLFLLVVQGFYLFLARLMNSSEEKGEVTSGLALFVLFVILYSSWCYYRLVYNNAMISYHVCTEEEYKREIFSTTGCITILFSLLYLYVNPCYVAIHLTLYYFCVFVLLVFANQNARYFLLFLYSGMLALPFMLIVKDSFFNWCFGMLLFTKQDPLFLLYTMVVVVANLAILHYVNGLSFIRLQDEEEEKLKED